ncbi:FRG domain-containing protein [Bradyrhizobium lablabi]|uniref:FRG domain-containing protein n=1 Tax=Bradyrhizobium lablabi TaxID=722472 RepID=UPI001BA9A6AD|nr:FRG domain-containing protein [Bradyrhizobium lablabi]MBR1122993.1 FRG domain-containing protein [Bradyrhizobium lablabi]
MARRAGKRASLAARTTTEAFARGFRVRVFQTWDQFKHGIRDELPGAHDYDVYKRYIFRGQGNANWPLKSSFDRTYSDKQAANRDRLAKELITEFYEECERYSAWRYSFDDPRVLAMAQHHGLPTRLLDWSFSPYVAAYFAFSWFLFEQRDGGGNVAIWVLNRGEVEAKAPGGQLQIISVQDHENNRLGNQFGLFTFLKTNEGSLEEYLTSRAVNLGSALVRLEIPRSECRTALQDLILMGIHHGTIFPGKEGIAQTIKLRNLLRQ